MTMADHPTEIVGEIQAYYRVRASTDKYATSPDFNLREVENHYLSRWLCDDIVEDILHLDGLTSGVIAQKIRNLLDDDALREKVGRGGREFVRQHLTWDQVGQDMKALLFSVVQTRRKDAAW